MAAGRFANTPDGVTELAAFCREHRVELAAMEATGGYERLAFGLLWAEGVPAAVVNPRAVRRFAEAMGLLARCFQHEHDHLQGTLYVNRLEGEARREAWRRIRAEDYARTVAEVRQERAGTLGSSFGG